MLPGTGNICFVGHTALRYEDTAHGEDWVFNSRMFSFNTSHFIVSFSRKEKLVMSSGVTGYPTLKGSCMLCVAICLSADIELTVGKTGAQKILEGGLYRRIGFTVITFAMIIALPVRVM